MTGTARGSMAAGSTRLLRRRAVGRLAALAGVLLGAGLLPWLTGGPLGARLCAAPLLLLGALGVTAAVRIRSIPLPTATDRGAPDRGATAASGPAGDRPPTDSATGPRCADCICAGKACRAVAG